VRTDGDDVRTGMEVTICGGGVSLDVSFLPQKGLSKSSKSMPSSPEVYQDPDH
jgi:hypothetical protein